MANYANLLATIAANIYTNNNNEVTAAMVKTAVDSMVASLGAGYQFMGMATPATNPGTPDYRCFWIATNPGTYTYMGGQVVTEGEIAFIKYDTAWSKVSYVPGAGAISEGDGFLNNAGNYQGGSTFSHKTTEIIPCAPGDVFWYYGRSINLAVAALFYSGSSIMGNKTLLGGEAYVWTKIVVPAGCDGVRFSSYEEVAIAPPRLYIMRESLMPEDVLLINGIKGKFHAGGFLRQNGTIDTNASIDSIITDEIAVSPGEEFYYYGIGVNYAAAAVFYNGSTIVGSCVSGMNSIGSSEPAWYVITIPSGVNRARFASLWTAGEEVPFKLLRASALGEFAKNISGIATTPIFYPRDGFLKSDGTYTGGGTFHSIETIKYPAYPGEKFLYCGFSINSAVAALFYTGDTIIGSHTCVSGEKGVWVVITAPAGCDGVKFSSFDETAELLRCRIIRGRDAIQAILAVTSALSPAVSPLQGKKINWLGDSYVANNGVPYTQSWEYLIAQKYGMTYRNYGINGNGLVSGTNPMSERYVEMDDDADYVMVVGGTNDFNAQTPISTFKADLATFIGNLVTKYPTAKIAFWTPWNAKGYAWYPSPKTYELEEYGNAIKEVCDEWGVPCFNATADGGVMAWSAGVRAALFQANNDYAHLNAAGHARFVSRAEAFLNSL